MPVTGISRSEVEKTEKNRRIPKNILELTLERLQKLYIENTVTPGRLVRLGMKPQWNTIMGSNNECGIARSFSGIRNFFDDPQQPETRKFSSLIGKPLFEIADWGIRSTDLQERSIALAAMCALSQPFLGSSALRNRGFLAQSWVAGDKLIQQYPTISRLVTRKDIVVVIGYGNEVRNLRNMCQELHVSDIRPKVTFGTVIFEKGVSYGPREIIVHDEKENEKVLGIANVVIISASTLVNDTFDTILKFSKKAHLIGIYGPDGSIIPDIFFDRGVDFVTSYRNTEYARFSGDLINEHDMEFSIRTSQKQYIVMRHQAKTRGTFIHKMLRRTANQ